VEPGAGVGDGLGSAEAVQNFATTLVPLLLEVWVEASATDSTWNGSEGAHLLSSDAMSILFQVLSILQLLRRLAPQKEHQDILVRRHTDTQTHRHTDGRTDGHTHMDTCSHRGCIRIYWCGKVHAHTMALL